MINNLTPEQITQLPTYREQWRSIALYTEGIDRLLATEAVNYFYGTIGFKPPTIMWFHSPYAALLTIAFKNKFTNPLVKQFKNDFFNPLLQELKSQISSDSYKLLTALLKNSLEKQLKSQFNAQIQKELRPRLRREITEKSQYRQILDAIASQCLPPELLACWGSLFDFARTELKCNLDEQKWLAFQTVVNTCGWIFPFADTVLICDRPNKLLFNSQGMLHAEAEPAISFVDDYSIYAYRGIVLPVEYGMLPPRKWHSKWLLKNHPVELKRAIIQGIGKTRIKEELTKEQLKIILREQVEYTKEQKAKEPKQIEKFEKKWQAIAFNEGTSQTKADLETISKKACALIGKEKLATKVIFAANPALGLAEIIDEKLLREISKKLANSLRNQNEDVFQESSINHLNSTDLGMTTADFIEPVWSEDIKTAFNSLDSLEVYSPLAELGEALEKEISSQMSAKFKEKLSQKFQGINRQLKTNLERKIYRNLIQKITKRLLAEINSQVGQELEIRLGNQTQKIIISELKYICEKQLEKKLDRKFADLGKYYQLGAWLDFCISVLDYKCDAEMWSAFQELAANCRWIYARENVCVVAEVSLNYQVRVKPPVANVSGSSSTLLQPKEQSPVVKTAKKSRGSLAWLYEKKPSMPLWKQVLFKVSLLVFGLPLLVFYLFVPLAKLSAQILKLLEKASGFLLLLPLMLPIKLGEIIAWLLINILRPFEALFKFVIRCLFFVGAIPLAPFIVTFNWAFNSPRRSNNNIRSFRPTRRAIRNRAVLPTTRLHSIRRVVQMQRDSEGRLHAEGEPAVIFDDGSREYYHHGVELLDPRYWVHPRQWQASWLLTEQDPDAFDVVIEEIGYARACMELRTLTLDWWREYILLEFADLIDLNNFERVFVLKMTCPSTGSVHALRVPPDIATAREAVRWVNWGTDPEEFVVET